MRTATAEPRAKDAGMRDTRRELPMFGRSVRRALAGACLFCTLVVAPRLHAAEEVAGCTDGDGCHAKLGRGAKVHGDPKPPDCIECHARAADDPAHCTSGQVRRARSGRAGCEPCHPAATEKYKHSAVLLERCVRCHDPHASDNPSLLIATGAALCFVCHADDVTGRVSVHAPISDGDCRVCHAVHAADNPQLLVPPVGSAGCMTCHGAAGSAERKIDLGRKTVHDANGSGECTVCHDPHGSNARALLIEPANVLCGSCHQAQRDGGHFFSGFDGSPHIVEADTDATRPGRPFDCTSCHDPHASDYPKLWYDGENKVEMCRRCHASTDGRVAPPSGLPPSGLPLPPGSARPEPVPPATTPPTAVPAPVPEITPPEETSR